MRFSRKTIIAAVAGAIAAAGLYLTVMTAEPTIEVLVAAEDISARTRLTDNFIQAARLPTSAVHPDALTPNLITADHVTVVNIFAGQQILTRHLIASGENPVTATLAPGKVAFLVPGGWDSVAGGTVESGDRINIIMVSDERRTGVTLARTLMRSVKVIDVRAETGQRWNPGSRGDVPVGVLVEVEPRDAERLALALTVGRLYVAVGESDMNLGIGVIVDELFAEQGEQWEDGP